MTTILRLAALAGGLVALAGCGGTRPADATPAAPPAAPPAADAKPDFVFDTAAWREEWRKDRDAAKEKYAGKVNELTGEVVFVHVEWDGLMKSGRGGMVNLKDEKIGPVTCITTDPQPWLTAAAGSKVRIRGRSGIRDGEELADCVIVEAGPSPALTA